MPEHVFIQSLSNRFCGSWNECAFIPFFGGAFGNACRCQTGSNSLLSIRNTVFSFSNPGGIVIYNRGQLTNTLTASICHEGSGRLPKLWLESEWQEAAHSELCTSEESSVLYVKAHIHPKNWLSSCVFSISLSEGSHLTMRLYSRILKVSLVWAITSSGMNFGGSFL
jgi:hypothetical protein